MSNGGREEEGEGEKKRGMERRERELRWCGRKDGWMDGGRKKTKREKRQKIDRQMTGKEQQERGNTGFRESKIEKVKPFEGEEEKSVSKQR